MIDAIAAARARDSLLELEAYCASEECPARQSTIRVKDHDGELLALLDARGGLHCPVCGAPLELHHAITFDEAEARRREDARASVAADMYMRDHGTSFVPAGVLMDTRLPPTPAGWWDRTDADSTPNAGSTLPSDREPR